MADDNKVNRSPEQIESRYDPEKEIPDPEQVEKDRQQAEKTYGEREKRDEPAA